MKSLILASAADIERWTNQIEASSLLPKLVRRIIQAITPGARTNFPAAEGSRLGGWDGTVATDKGGSFVPPGISAWELSTDKDVKGKADGDYDKRTKNPLGIDTSKCTYVAVTARRWSSKESWVAERSRERKWKEVRAYDAEDLEQILEQAPAVHVWFSILIGKHPEKVVDFENFWADWSNVTRPATSAAVLLAGRGKAIENIRLWLEGSADVLTIQGESREEALAVLAAILQTLPPDEQLSALARTILVKDIETWNHLAASCHPLILVQDFDSVEAIGRASRSGHRVIIPIGRPIGTVADAYHIPSLVPEEVEKALAEMGIAPEQIRDLAILAARNLMAFRRKLALSPEMQKPPWSRPEQARSLIPALLAGVWKSNKDGDKEVLASLAGSKYSDVNSSMVRWAHEADAPVRCIGHVWFVNSRDDAWSLLSGYLTGEDFDRLEPVVLSVLCVPDPRIEVPDGKRLVAEMLGESPKYSRKLFEGLAELLAMMGSRGGGMSSPRPSDVATAIVRKLLDTAATDWRIWASLSRVLPLLAEAAPDVFFAAVERGTTGADPILLRLFNDRDGGLFTPSHHTGLLWALETLAWNPDYLSRSALLLARLARIAPKVQIANKPERSLRDIFLPWMPQTSASLEKRLEVLRVLAEREHDVTWPLLGELLPKFWGVAQSTARPQWRQEWALPPHKQAPIPECISASEKIIELMLLQVGESGTRWRVLLDALPSLPAPQFSSVVERLEALDADRIRPEDRMLVWDELRKLVAHHRSFPDADWSIPEAKLARIDEVQKRFAPPELAARHAWLFGASPALLEGRKDDWHAQQEAVSKARQGACAQIHACGGLNELFNLCQRAEQPVEVGLAIGLSKVLMPVEEDCLLLDHLASEDGVRAQLAWGYIHGKYLSLGKEWAISLMKTFEAKWSTRQKAEFLLCLPYETQSWDKATEWGTEVERLYWQRANPHQIRNSLDVERVVKSLLKHGRPYAAIVLLNFFSRRDKPIAEELIAETLESAAKVTPGKGESPASLSYEISELLRSLDKSIGIDSRRIAIIEWFFLPILDHHERSPKNLHEELKRNPKFFAEMLSVVYTADEEGTPEASEEKRNRARNAYRLLKSLKSLPGVREDGGIDPAGLKKWVKEARQAVAESGLEEIGDENIGEILCHSPQGEDGSWPHGAVRDIIEETASDHLESGIRLGVLNGRGTVSKAIDEGGFQERAIAKRYSSDATSVADRWPRTAAMLRSITSWYESQAKGEDEEVKLRQHLES